MSFIKEILPYFMASYAFVVSHIAYQMTGNLLIPIWLAYLLSMSQFWRSPDYHETNLDQASETVFKRDWRFIVPVYAFVINDALHWYWCMFIVSGWNPLEGTAGEFIFENRHGSGIGNWCVFIFVAGYMGGVNGLAGHELIHKRETANKFWGMWTYTKMFYSHFTLEHSSGHHRNIATPDDPATARQGENFYEFFPKSVYGSHMGTFKREV